MKEANPPPPPFPDRRQFYDDHVPLTHHDMSPTPTQLGESPRFVRLSSVICS